MAAKPSRTFGGAIAALALGGGAAQAQLPPIDTNPSPDELRNIFTLQIENDVFNRIGKSDRDYTNGVRFGWLSPALPDLPDAFARLTTFPTFFGEGPVSSVTRRVGISIGQNLYTPQDTDTSARFATTGHMPRGSIPASPCNRPTSASIPRPTRRSPCGSTRCSSISA